MLQSVESVTFMISCSFMTNGSTGSKEKNDILKYVEVQAEGTKVDSLK